VARDADGLHQALHSMASAVVAYGDTTHVALASGLELIVAR